MQVQMFGCVVLYCINQSNDFKLKELIKKYKDKVFEIEGIKELREKWVSERTKTTQEVEFLN